MDLNVWFNVLYMMCVFPSVVCVVNSPAYLLYNYKPHSSFCLFSLLLCSVSNNRWMRDNISKSPWTNSGNGHSMECNRTILTLRSAYNGRV
ncbi:hypothetical protein AAZV13_02G113600 [Glycine max]